MRALISGVTRDGIGGAVARRLATEAAGRGDKPRLALCSTGRRPGILELAAELEEAGADVLTLAGDLSDPATPELLVRDALAFLGGLDGLVLNAGVSQFGALAELPTEDWDYLFSVNVRSAWLLAKAAYPALRESKGAIVATASVGGTVPGPRRGAYAPSKAALIMLGQTLALEWAADGINVNLVSPGFVATPMSADRYSVAGLMAERKAMVPTGQIGSPDDMAKAICFLLQADASYITGENLVVDGGLSRSAIAGSTRPKS